MGTQTPTTYNPAAVALVIDGVILDGLSTDGVTVNREATSEYTEGMDTGGTLDHNPSTTYDVTASFRAGSAGGRQLSDIQKIAFAAMAAGSAHSSISGTVRDPISGSVIESADVLFLNEPFPDFAQASGNIEFQMKFVNAITSIAPNIL